MKKLEILLLAAGLVMIAVIARQTGWQAALGAVSAVGWGFALVFAQEIVAHVCNTLGWKYSITPEIDNALPFNRVLVMRIAGDGINYLTPSATLAGEWARAAMMGRHHALEDRVSSVALAKLTQTLAMAVFSIIGLSWVFAAHIDIASLKTLIGRGGWVLAAIIAVVIALELRASGAGKEKVEGPATEKETLIAKLKSIDKCMMEYLRRYPGRFALSVWWFFLAYAWGAFEVWLICNLMGMKVGWGMCMLVETLSVFVDAIFFAVPAKAGTQEASKTAIFAALNLGAATGLAFGIVRHIREILWAVTGFGLYYAFRTGPAPLKPGEAAE